MCPATNHIYLNNNNYNIYLLLVGHAGPGDVEVGKLREAGPEDVGVHPGQRHAVQGQLGDTGAWKYSLQIWTLLLAVNCLH